MENVLFALLVVVIVLLGFVLLRFNNKKDSADAPLMLQRELQDLRKTLDSKLGESTRLTQDQLSESAKIIRDVTEKLTRLDETNKQVINFADQLQSLQDILQNPKQRGILGEYYLETVLKNVLPPSAYAMQHKIGTTAEGKDLIVDAAIFVQDKIIPVDSKFSLENYNRLAEERAGTEKEKLEKQFKQDLKNRIDETAKYIRPQDKTMEFALMFIPSEAIFYDLLINKVGAVRISTEDLVQYAAKRKVSIVSPNSFLAFLQVILQGLKQMQIEKSAHVVIKRVEQLGRHLKNHDQYLLSLGKSLGTTVGHYNKVHKEFSKIDKDVMRLTGAGLDVEELTLDKPEGKDE